MSNEPHASLNMAALVEALPRMLGYVPTGRVSVVMLREQDGQTVVTVVASVPHHADAAEAGRQIALAGRNQPEPVTRAIVIGWADDAPVGSVSNEVADALILEGIEVVATFTVDRDGLGLTDARTGAIIQATPADQIEGIDRLGARPTGDRADLALMWRAVGSLTPADHGLWWVACWEAVMWGDATNAQIEQAAHALSDLATRDRILAALTGLNLGMDDLGDAAALRRLKVTSTEGVEVLRDTVTRLADDESNVPMLTVILGIAWSASHLGYAVIAEQIAATPAGRDYPLAGLLIRVIAAGLSPAGLRD